MATLDWHLTRTGGVTLVELLVTAESPCAVRVESALEPVWPPRVRGVPAAGWQDGAFEAELDGDERLIIGYASPAAPVEPPAELTTDPPDRSTSLMPRDLIRALGDGKPPRDAVPTQQSAHSGNGHSASAGRPESSPDSAGLPLCVTSWLNAIEDRLAATTQSPDATGPEHEDSRPTANPHRHLDGQLAADRQQLAQLGRRQQELWDRLDALDHADGDCKR